MAHDSDQEAPTGAKVGLANRENSPLEALSGLDFLIWDHITCSPLVLAHHTVQDAPTAPKVGLAYRKNIPLEALPGLDFLIWDHVSCSRLSSDSKKVE